MLNALKGVSDWVELGIQLDVEMQQIKEIEDQYRYSPRCKIELLGYWLTNEHEPSWDKLVTALKNMDKRSIARKITTRFLQPRHSPPRTAGCRDRSYSPIAQTRSALLHTTPSPKQGYASLSPRGRSRSPRRHLSSSPQKRSQSPSRRSRSPHYSPRASACYEQEHSSAVRRKYSQDCSISPRRRCRSRSHSRSHYKHS